MISTLSLFNSFFFVVFGLICVTSCAHQERQMPLGLNVRRVVDGNIIYGSADGEPQAESLSADANNLKAQGEENEIDSISSLLALDRREEQELSNDIGLVDILLGQGIQGRIVSSLTKWAKNKVRQNPICVERLICETYKVTETFSGVPYVALSLTNAAMSFVIADLFDQKINANVLTKAAREGRTNGKCQRMRCDIVDKQLRAVGGYISTLDEFFSAFFGSVSNSINLWK